MAKIRRTRAEWLTLVSEWRESGKTAERFCSKLGIRPVTMKWWAWKFDGERVVPSTTELVPVRLATKPIVSAGMFELELRDARLRFEVGTDPGYVAAVARAIGAGDSAW
jgi:hypothetical protein